MCRILKLLVPNCNPATILLDVERTAMCVYYRSACVNAFTLDFPNINLKCCYFHLFQSVIRKCNSIGMKRLFETDPEFNIKVRSLPALSSIPIGDLFDA